MFAESTAEIMNVRVTASYANDLNGTVRFPQQFACFTQTDGLNVFVWRHADHLFEQFGHVIHAQIQLFGYARIGPRL